MKYWRFDYMCLKDTKENGVWFFFLICIVCIFFCLNRNMTFSSKTEWRTVSLLNVIYNCSLIYAHHIFKKIIDSFHTQLKWYYYHVDKKDFQNFFKKYNQMQIEMCGKTRSRYVDTDYIVVEAELFKKYNWLFVGVLEMEQRDNPWKAYHWCRLKHQ